MVTLREIHLPDQPFFDRTQTLSNEHAAALLELEKRIGVQCWEVVPTEFVTETATDAVNTGRSASKKG
jgi:hypothetical protein